MGRLFPYRGPSRLVPASGARPAGVVVETALQFADLADDPSQERLGDGSVAFTYVVDQSNSLRVANRRSEHVVCAGGEPVLAAGELFVTPGRKGSWVVRASNFSNGYMPSEDSFMALKLALERARLPAPKGFDPAIAYRYCGRCMEAVIAETGACRVCQAALALKWDLDASVFEPDEPFVNSVGRTDRDHYPVHSPEVPGRRHAMPDWIKEGERYANEVEEVLIHRYRRPREEPRHPHIDNEADRVMANEREKYERGEESEILNNAAYWRTAVVHSAIDVLHKINRDGGQALPHGGKGSEDGPGGGIECFPASHTEPQLGMHQKVRVWGCMKTCAPPHVRMLEQYLAGRSVPKACAVAEMLFEDCLLITIGQTIEKAAEDQRFHTPQLGKMGKILRGQDPMPGARDETHFDWPGDRLSEEDFDAALSYWYREIRIPYLKCCTQCMGDI